MANSNFIITANWLKTHLTNDNLSIIDASWYLPAQNRNAKQEYDAEHIPGSVFFDQDEIVEPSNQLPHTLPSPEIFAHHVGKLGLTQNKTIIVYDGPGLFSAARVWWLLRIMGAKEVYILAGGFDSWKTAGYPVTSKKTITPRTNFETQFDADKVVFFERMQELVKQSDIQIIDARSRGRFRGDEPEPRAGMRSGHMPNAINLPYNELIQNGTLKDITALKDIFKERGIDIDKPIVTSCGSGVTAAIINLALASLGQDNSQLYDGSWAQWGSRNGTAIVTGD